MTTSLTHPLVIASNMRPSKEQTMALAPVAGILYMLRKIQFKLLVRKGYIINNLRGGNNSFFKSKIGDGFGVMKARALTSVQKSIPFSQILSDDTHENPSKGATKSAHRLLNNDNFEELTRFKWKLITQRDVSKYTNEDQVTACEYFLSSYSCMKEKQRLSMH